MCPTETVHLDKVFQRSACQSHFAPAFGRTQGDSREVARAVNTDSFVVVFIGLTKPLAFPDLSCQGYVSHSFQFFFGHLVLQIHLFFSWFKLMPDCSGFRKKKSQLMSCSLSFFLYRNLGFKIEWLVNISTKNVGLLSQRTWFPCPCDLAQHVFYGDGKILTWRVYKVFINNRFKRVSN